MLPFSHITVVGCLLASPALPLPLQGEKKRGEAVELTKDEQALLDLTNEARKKEKLPPLRPSAVLTRLARDHSANMARQEKMEHVLDGKNPVQRAEAAGYPLGRLGENIAAGNGWTLEAVLETWMDSKPHRANILSDRFTEIGLGLARSGKGEWYYTQVFGKPKK
jgi:uncharacterized protein YkwD